MSGVCVVELSVCLSGNALHTIFLRVKVLLLLVGRHLFPPEEGKASSSAISCVISGNPFNPTGQIILEAQKTEEGKKNPWIWLSLLWTLEEINVFIFKVLNCMFCIVQIMHQLRKINQVGLGFLKFKVLEKHGEWGVLIRFPEGTI